MKKKINIFLFVMMIIFIQLISVISTPFISAESDDDKKPIVIGFAQDTMANDWRIAQVRELQNAFKPYPYINFFYTDAGGQTSKQIKDIEDMIYAKVDILITSPRDSKMMTPVIAKAFRMGIPVILLSRRIETEDYSIFIHPDNRAIAAQAADYIAARLDGRGKVFILQHIPTTTPAIHRTEGFSERLKKYPAMEIAGMKVANSLRADAIRMTEEALREGLEFDAIYAQSDSMAGGARLALKKAGKNPSHLVIVGIDYITEAKEAILQGEQDASFTYPTGGKEGAAFALKIINGETIPKEYIIESIMVTKDNVESVEPIF